MTAGLQWHTQHWLCAGVVGDDVGERGGVVDLTLIVLVGGEAGVVRGGGVSGGSVRAALLQVVATRTTREEAMDGAASAGGRGRGDSSGAAGAGWHA